jgi:polysaccharide biosynthesis transport protein
MAPKTAQLTESDDPVRLPLLLASHLRKHWLLSLSLFAATLAGTLFHTLSQTPIYRSATTILIDPNPPRPLGKDVQSVVDVGTGLYWNNQEYYQTQYRIIQSRSLAERTVRQLGLEKDQSFLQNRGSGDPVEPGGPATVEGAAMVLLGRLEVSPIKDSRLVNISVDDADPERARRVLSTLIDLYIDQNVDRALESSKSASEWLNVQLDKLKNELTDNELALHDYKKEQNILSVSMDDQNNMLREEMTQLNAELTRVRVERERLRTRLEQLNKVDAENLSTLPAQELLDSPVLTSLRANHARAQEESSALTSAGKGDNHPEVKASEARAASSRQALVEEINNIKTAVSRSYTAKQHEAAGLLSLFEKAKDEALELNRLELEYRRLERSKINTEKLYSLVLERTKESDLTEMMRFNNISIVDVPTLPVASVKPRLSMNLGVGALGGLLLGLVGAFLRASLDRTLNDPDEIESLLGVPLLGLLPRNPRSPRNRVLGVEKTDLGLLVHTEPQSAAAEAARAIRTNLTFTAPDRPKRRLLVTSAGLSEGKTTVVCNVALSFAHAGQRTLLIDCDLRKPRLHGVFGLTNHFGVTSAVVDPSALDVANLATKIPNLSVLTSGPHAPNPAEILQSEHFRELLERVAPHFDRILLDSPPVAAVTDASILSTMVDATVFVVRGGKTRADVARQAVRALRDVRENLVGVVMNSVARGSGGYGGYYYGYYGHPPDRPAGKAAFPAKDAQP